MTAVMFGLPHYTCKTDTRTALALASTLATCGGFEVVSMRIADVIGVANARNALMARALESPAQWLVMFDADVYWSDTAAFWRMLRESVGLGAALVGAPVAERTGRINVRRRGEVVTPGPSIESADGIGFGLVAFWLPWYRRHWPRRPWFVELQLDAGPIGEDMFHCARVRQLDGRVYVDGRFKPEHAFLRPGDVL